MSTISVRIKANTVFARIYKKLHDNMAVIAATALDGGFMVATKYTSPFEAAGLEIINPWNQPSN